MAYGADQGLFIGSGPALVARSHGTRRSSGQFAAWPSLTADRRLALVEKALGARASDGLPVAL